MAGHSKWSKIKRQKKAEDRKRSKLFTKLAREIAVATREGGPDPDPETNLNLRLAIERAKDANMPKENIERAIKRGTGELLDEGRVEEVLYESYGPHGTAILMHVLTDNRNRTVAAIRKVLNRNHGHLGEEGSVTWLFEQKGYIVIEADGDDEEELALLAIDAGAEDVLVSDSTVEVYTVPTDLQAVKEVLEKDMVSIETAELSMVPKSLTQLDNRKTLQTMRLIEELEDLDDVQRVYSNLDISDEVMAEYENAEAA